MTTEQQPDATAEARRSDLGHRDAPRWVHNVFFAVLVASLMFPPLSALGITKRVSWWTIALQMDSATPSDRAFRSSTGMPELPINWGMWPTEWLAITAAWCGVTLVMRSSHGRR